MNTTTTDTTTTNTMNIMNTTNNLILTAIMAAFDTAVDAAVLRAIAPLDARIKELEETHNRRDAVEVREIKDYIRDSIGDALDEYDFSDVVKNEVDSSAERMIEKMTQHIDDRLDLAINEHDFSDEVKEAVESAIQDHDFESQIESALENYDFSSAMESALENHDFGSEIEEKVTEMIDEALESLSITRG